MLVISTITSSAIAIYMFNSKDERGLIAPDYAKSEIEENAEPFGNQEAEMPEQPEKGSGNVDIIYKKDVFVDLSKNIVSLLLGNPKTSDHDLLIQIYIKELLIAESGMVKAGNQVKELGLEENVRERLVSGEYEGIIKVYFYDCISAEKSLVDVKIPVVLTVRE